MIPKHWKTKELNEVATVQTGIAKGKKDLKDPVFRPYLRVANVQDGYLDLSEIKTIEVEASQVERYALKYNDVLVTEGGDADKLGRGHIWKDEIKGCLHQNHVFAVRVDPNVLTPEFFNHLTSSPYGKRYFMSCAKQSTNLASINSTQLKEFPVLLPPLPEQQKIAEILGSWDTAIEQLETLIEKKQLLKRGLMQKLLSGKVRFPEFEGEEWSILELKSVVDFLDNKRVPLKEEDRKQRKGKFPYYGASGIIDFIDDYIFDEETILLAEDGENILSRNSPIAYRANGKYWVNNHAHVLKPKNGLDAAYLVQVLENVDYSKYNSGTAQPKINKASCEKILIPIVSLNEQRRISEIFVLIENHIDGHWRELQMLKTQKLGLMQQLLTGKCRVRIGNT